MKTMQRGFTLIELVVVIVVVKVVMAASADIALKWAKCSPKSST